MTSNGTFEIREPTGDRLDLQLVGSFDQVVASALEAKLKERVDRRAWRKILIDCCALKQCDIQARTLLASIHRMLKKPSTRVAYLADSSLMRGLGLWLCHLAEDPNAKPFGEKAQAEAWLDGKQSRVENTHESFLAAAKDLSTKGRP